MYTSMEDENIEVIYPVRMAKIDLNLEVSFAG